MDGQLPHEALDFVLNISYYKFRMGKAYNLDNIEALFRDYLSAGNSNLGTTTIKNYLSDFKHFMGWIRAAATHAGTDEPISALINEESLRSYLQYLSSQELPIKTLSRRLSTLRKFIQFGEHNDLNLLISSSVLKQNRTTVVKNVVDSAKEVLEKPLDIMKKNHKRFFSGYKIVNYVGIVFVAIALFTYVPSKISNLLNYATKSSKAITSAPTKTGRVFAFQGKLVDSRGNNITSLTSIQFKLYGSATTKNALYQTGNCSITPDRNGYFSVLIGGASMSPPPVQDTCGKEVGAGVFNENSNVYLGTTVASDNEMLPRQPIANVGYAVNSDTINGLPLGSSNSSVPFISSDGSVILSLDSPSITSTYRSGTFSIRSGSDLSLQTGRDGDLSLIATGSGSIRLRTGDSTVNRIYVSDAGNVGISTSTPTYFRLEVSGDIGPELSGVYDIGSSTRIWNDVFTDRLCFDGSSDCISNSLGIFSAIANSSSSQLVIKDSLVSGSSTTSGTTTLDIAGAGTSYALCHSSKSGTDNEKIVDCNSTPTADFAEMYPVESGTEFGDVMTLGSKIVKTFKNEEIRQLVKADKPYDGHTIGIVSNNYDDFISVGHNISKGDNPMPIALKGRVPVKISSNSNSIQAGDYITTSTEAGKAMKSTGDGVVIGRALESWEQGSIKNQIMVFVGIDYVVQSQNPFQLLAQGITSAISAQIETLTAQRIVSPVVQTSEINPEPGKDLTINLSSDDNVSSASSELSKLVVKGVKKAVVASIDSQGNLESKGTIKAENGIFNNSITADTIKSKTTDSLSDNLNDVQAKLLKLSLSTGLTPTPSPIPSDILSAIPHDLLTSRLVVTELADIYELSVQDKIAARSETLHLIASSSISFFDGSTTFSKDGNLVAKGKITAKELEIKSIDGITVAAISSTGSATLNNLRLPKTAGSSIIAEGENEVKVYNPGLSESSLIYVTPETDIGIIDRPLVVNKRLLCKASDENCDSYFSVAISTNNHPDIKFNWLIIN